MAPVDLKKNKDTLLGAHKDVSDPKSATNWAIFGYEGQTDALKLVGKGDGGISEWLDELSSGRILYSYLKVIDPNTDLPKFVFVNWQGEGVPENRKGACANHVRDVESFFKGAHVSINARTEDDVDEELIKSKVAKASGANYSFHKEVKKPMPAPEPVGSVYQRVKPQIEIKPQLRDKFWEDTANEEKKRQADEKQRKQSERSKLDQEAKDREARDAKAREERESERFRKIQEMKAHEKKANAPSKTDETKWEAEQVASKRDEDERGKRSDQMRTERAAEAKMLASQRTADARSAFEQKPKSQFDEPAKGPAPPRKIKSSFLDEGSQQQEAPAQRKTPISLPKAEQPEEIYDDTVAVSERHGAPEDIYDDTAGVAPQPPPSDLPKTRNLLAEGLPKRQTSDDEQEEEQDWDGGNRDVESHKAPPLEDFDMPGQRPSASEELYEDTVAMRQDSNQASEDIYEDTAITTHPGKGGDVGVKARALYDYQAAEDNEITFDPDDIIRNIEMIDDGWWLGDGPDGKRGMFPSNYVEVID